MTENALVVRNEMSLQDTMTLGKTLASSGYFDDASQVAQAVVKILAGRELGLGPIASMTGIHIIKKKVTLGANVMAATVKRDPRYDYRVLEMEPTACEIAFFEGSTEIGRSRFTIEDAQRAGTQNLTKFPRNMLFARAMSNGVKWFCPDAFSGSPVYTPDELGAQVDGEGELIEMPQQPAPTTPVGQTREVYGDFEWQHREDDPDHAAAIAEAQQELAGLEQPPTAARNWPGATIQAIVDANLARPAKHAVKMLNLSDVLRTTDELEFVMVWANHYRGQRETGKEPEDAAKWADEQMPKPTD